MAQPSFRQSFHIEDDIDERIEEAWTFRPLDGGVRGQDYTVLCIVAPSGTNQTTKNDTFGLKVFGCFPTLEKANEYSKKLQKENNFFDYYVVKTLEWVKLPPVVEKLEDMHYMEKELEDLKESVMKMRETRAQMMRDRVFSTKKKPNIRADTAIQDTPVVENTTDLESTTGVEEAKQTTDV